MAAREGASLMSVRAHIANWPLAWKAPLLAAGLLIGVAFVISQIVLNRLESDQENNLRLLTSAYLDGLSAAVLPSAVHGDVWEAFAALDRARDRYAGLKVRFAIVALPNGKVLAASDPTQFPVQSGVPPEVDPAFPDPRRSYYRRRNGPSMACPFSSRGRLFGRPHSGGNRHFRVASRARKGVADAPRRQRRPRAGICDNRLSRAQAHAKASKRTQRIRGARSSRTRGPYSGVEATAHFQGVRSLIRPV